MATPHPRHFSVVEDFVTYIRITSLPLSRIQVTDLGQDLRDGQVCSRTIIANFISVLSQNYSLYRLPQFFESFQNCFTERQFFTWPIHKGKFRKILCEQKLV
jgi:hypothetical protein